VKKQHFKGKLFCKLPTYQGSTWKIHSNRKKTQKTQVLSIVPILAHRFVVQQRFYMAMKQKNTHTKGKGEETIQREKYGNSMRVSSLCRHGKLLRDR
jgi:hypothetical protein